jgi:hypothetical protein
VPPSWLFARMGDGRPTMSVPRRTASSICATSLAAASPPATSAYVPVMAQCDVMPAAPPPALLPRTAHYRCWRSQALSRLLQTESFVTNERMIRVLCVVLYKTGDPSQACMPQAPAAYPPAHPHPRRVLNSTFAYPNGRVCTGRRSARRRYR